MHLNKIIRMSLAYVLINCELGYEKPIITKLKEIPEVKEVHGTFGVYDIVVKVMANDIAKIRETITWKIRKIPNILNTLTLLKIESQG